MNDQFELQDNNHRPESSYLSVRYKAVFEFNYTFCFKGVLGQVKEFEKRVGWGLLLMVHFPLINSLRVNPHQRVGERLEKQEPNLVA